MIVETSVAHPHATLLMGGVRGVVLASRYLIEPTSNGRSKVMHLARVDTKYAIWPFYHNYGQQKYSFPISFSSRRGRSPDWYNKCYGHICSQYLSRIRSAFKHSSIGSDGKP